MAALAFYKRSSSGKRVYFECIVIKSDAAGRRAQPIRLCSKMLSVQNILPFCSKMDILFVLLKGRCLLLPIVYDRQLQLTAWEAKSSPWEPANLLSGPHLILSAILQGATGELGKGGAVSCLCTSTARVR